MWLKEMTQMAKVTKNYMKFEFSEVVIQDKQCMNNECNLKLN